MATTGLVLGLPGGEVGAVPAPAQVRPHAAVVSTDNHHYDHHGRTYSKDGSKAHHRHRTDTFKVRPGPSFNSPLGGAAAGRVLIAKVNRAINHTHKGSTIRIMSWKIWTRAGVTDLLRAQRRGVVIHVLMDKKNTIIENNPHFWRLKRGLRAGNKGRKVGHRSAAKLCDHSCRGKGGAAHSKFMLFSKTGQSHMVYMEGSANWGDAAANLQWNDMYTFVGNQGIYDFAGHIFDQMWNDKPVPHPWQTWTGTDGKVTAAFAPKGSIGRKTDRLVRNLRATRCHGATGGAGTADGRTIIRSTPDVIRGTRGMAVAQLLRRLWDRGCDVKIGYTVMGRDVSQLLDQNNGRGPVPRRHLVQDFNGDGIFDRYFHLKVFTINGHIGSDTSAYWMQQGSSNTSDLAEISDENIVYFKNLPRIVKRYQNHISYWFTHFPQTSRLSPRVTARVKAGKIDPYQNMELD